MRTLLVAVACLLVNAMLVSADVVWSEDFSDVGDWKIGYDPGGSSTLTTDGSVASLYVNSGASEAAFTPDNTVKPYAAFDPSKKSQYTLSILVDSITTSTSYDVALDLFDSSFNFIRTEWNVFPDSGTSVAVGLQSVNLGTKNFDANTAYLMPKINVHTGDGAQTVGVDDLTITTAIPEPSSALLGIVGLLGVVWAARKR